jgi:hypothetical protein
MANLGLLLVLLTELQNNLLLRAPVPLGELHNNLQENKDTSGRFKYPGPGSMHQPA